MDAKGMPTCCLLKVVGIHMAPIAKRGMWLRLGFKRVPVARGIGKG